MRDRTPQCTINVHSRTRPRRRSEEEAMAHHHKSNKAVEGDPDTGHGGGLPQRPDEAELEERTEVERVEAGLPADPGATAADTDPEAEYSEAEAEVDRQADSGELAQEARVPKKDREAFPPSDYNG
jgi:hypothetical protein